MTGLEDRADAPWSEDAVHRWLVTLPDVKARAAGAMHDAATLHALDGAPVTCVDQCIEGVHFDATAPRRAAGAKAVLRALSDLAASAAEPRAVTLAVRADRRVSTRDLQDVILGAREAAEPLGASLVAGDLACAPGPLGLTVTALGVLSSPWPPPERARATPGEVVALSGPVGGSLLSGRHLAPVPRVAAGIEIARAGASALMDVSDGLAWDLYRLARTAGVRIELQLDAIPVHPDALQNADPIHAALHDGEDHELLATIESGALEALRHAWAPVGAVREGQGLVLIDGAGTERAWEPGTGGWEHRA